MTKKAIASTFWVFLLFAVSGIRDSCAETQAPRKPNIILIVADDLGYGELGVQGYTHDIPTPNIDSLARNGVRFTQGYVTAPLCSPTRAGLLSGRYQQRFGHELNPGPEASVERFGLPRNQPTLAERLKALGYATGMVGKWHLGLRSDLTPSQRGFDEFFGFLGGAHTYLGSGRAGPILRGTTPVDEKEYLTDAFAREAVAFIDKHKGAPFFLYLPFNAVHAPLQATDKYLSRFPAIKDTKRRTFAAMTAAMDDAVGRVLGKLADLTLTNDTLIFFISDNGGPTPGTTSSNGPLRGHKGEVFEGGIRVPFIMQWKGHLPAGKVNELPVISLDIHPTAVVAAGGAIAADWKLDGVDLLPYVRGDRTGRPHETLFWRMGEKHAIRDGDWKLLVEQGTTTPALFNLADDIGEKNDLAAKMPDKAKQLNSRYDAWKAQMVAPAWKREGGHRGGGRLMKRFDRNTDGKLTPDEFPRPRVFRQMDTNGDSMVTADEAKAFRQRRAAGNAEGAAPH